MCGIVGYISNNDKIYEGPKDHFMRYALALDTLRGEDSTGLITLSKRFTVKTLKTTMAGDAFVHSADYKKKFRTGWAQIGHNRAATRGGITIENTHPFTFGSVTMVHNGTLYQGGNSLETFDKKIGDVDSMQICYALSKYPPEKAAEVLSQIDGSFALVWSDSRDESINMARNSERPLHFTFNSSKSIMWYMSDGHHLHSINKSFGQHECKGQSVFEMDRQKILKFRKGDTKPEVIKFNPFVRTVYGNQNKWKKPKTQDKKTTVITIKNTKTGGKNSKSALEIAGETWKRKLESCSTSNSINGKESPVKVELQGRKRKVPSCMQAALKSELYLTPEDLLQFQPDDAEQLPNGNYVVYGTMIHKDWSDTPWEMTIYNVPKIQYRAYKDADWLVRPIGLCPPHEFDRHNAATLGHLIHCDWDGYNATCYPESDSSDDDKEEDSADSPILVPGPNGCMMLWSKLRPMLEGGCINCGEDMINEEMQDCIEVNNGQDLICAGCVKELTETNAIIPTIN